MFLPIQYFLWMQVMFKAMTYADLFEQPKKEKNV